jgi:hypothetical protein
MEGTVVGQAQRGKEAERKAVVIGPNRSARPLKAVY